MKVTKNIGFLLLGAYLIISGLLKVVSIDIPNVDVILAVLAIASGALIVIGR